MDNGEICGPGGNMMYVDVHCHLTHEKFQEDSAEVIAEAGAARLGAIVVNGLDPDSNRRSLAMAALHPIVKAALGIYPVYAVNHLAQHLPYPVPRFDVGAEIKFIEEAAQRGEVAAIGECGLDGYWLGEETHALQEQVFAQLIDLAVRTSLPLIVHSRKLELRTLQMLRHYKASRVVMHCFGGKVSMALEAARQDGFSFSIPANAARNEAFRKMLTELPLEAILTETDAPYLSPTPQVRNRPVNVIGTVQLMASCRNFEEARARDIIWDNYVRLFSLQAGA